MYTCTSGQVRASTFVSLVTFKFSIPVKYDASRFERVNVNCEQPQTVLAMSRKLLVFIDGSNEGNRAFNEAVRWKQPSDTLLVVHLTELVNQQVMTDLG